MSLFIYPKTAPAASVTLRLADGTERDVYFHPGRSVDLPDDHPYVTRLLARGLLEHAPAPIPAPAPVARAAKTTTATPKEA